MAESGSTETVRQMAQDGADITSPTAMPTGGWGIRGWLSALYTWVTSSESGLIYGKTDYTLDTQQAIKIDSYSHAMTTIEFENTRINDGRNFFVRDCMTLAINNVLDITFITPDIENWSHMFFSVSPESETELYLYEDASIISSAGTITPLNNNRNSSLTADETVNYTLSTSLANANLATDVTTATQIAHETIGSGKDGGSSEQSSKVINKQNTTYCLRLIANSAGYVNFAGRWYRLQDQGV